MTPERETEILAVAKTAIPIVLIVAGIIGFSVWLLRDRNKSFQVVTSSWTTQSDLRQKTQYHGAEWGRPWGKDAFNIQCHSRYYGQQRCFCHEVCSGPTKTRSCHQSCSSCPEYRDWCEYDYWEWPIIKTMTNFGLPEVDPSWPTLTANGPDQRVDQSVTFNVQWIDEENERTDWRAASIQDLRRFHHRDWWQVTVNHAGKFVPVKILTGESDD